MLNPVGAPHHKVDSNVHPSDTLVAILTVIEKEAGGGFHPMVHIEFPGVPGCITETWCYETSGLEMVSYKKIVGGGLELRHKYDGGTVVTEVIPYPDKVEFVAHVENQTKEPPNLNMCWQLRESPTFKAIDEDHYSELINREFIFMKDKGRVFLDKTTRRIRAGSKSSEWFNQPYSWIQIYKSGKNEKKNKNKLTDCSGWSNCSPDHYDVPIIGAVSKDDKWLTALAADSSAMSLCNAWHDCMHIWPEWRNGIWRTVIYAMENNPDKLLARYHEDFSQKLSGNFNLTVVDFLGNTMHCLVEIEKIPEGENIFFPQEVGMTTNGSNRPQWKDKIPVKSTGNFSKSLEPGTYRLTVGKGLEYEPIVKEFTINDHDTVALTVQLHYFVNMPSRGWWSGDDHVHSTRMLGTEPSFLGLAQCEDVHFTNVLQMGLWWEQKNPMDGDELEHWDEIVFGRNNSKAHKTNYWLIHGEEHPRTPTLGHSLMLNVDDFIHHEDYYYLYDKVWQQCRDSGATTGYAHFYKKVDPRWGPVLGHPIQFAEGRVDFVEIADNRYLDDPDLYFEMLNMGFMIPATAGTDYPYGLEVGDNRTYVYIDPDSTVSPDQWTEGLKAGHTFITTGPLLDFTINGKMIGSVIHVNKGEKINIKAVGYGHPIIGSPEEVSLISMGDEIKHVTSDNLEIDTLILSYTHKIKQSQWFLIHVDGHNGSFALSSPIYVIVDNKRAIDYPSLKKNLAFRLSKIDTLKIAADYIPEYQKEDFLKRVDNAEKFWKAMPDTLPNLLMPPLKVKVYQAAQDFSDE